MVFVNKPYPLCEVVSYTKTLVLKITSLSWEISWKFPFSTIQRQGQIPIVHFDCFDLISPDFPSRHHVHYVDTIQTPSKNPQDTLKKPDQQQKDSHSFCQKLGVGTFFLPSSFFPPVTGESKVNSNSDQLKLTLICKF